MNTFVLEFGYKSKVIYQWMIDPIDNYRRLIFFVFGYISKVRGSQTIFFWIIFAHKLPEN